MVICLMTTGQWSYFIDFRQMTQQNTQHQDHTIRTIRRHQVSTADARDLNKRYPPIGNEEDNRDDY